LVPALAPARVPDGAVTTPLRTRRVERGQHRGAVLDHRRARRALRARFVLRRLPARDGIPLMETGATGRGYAGRRVLVAGSGVAGAASAEVLLGLGAHVVVLDRTETEAVLRLKEAGAAVVLGEEPPADVIAAVDDVVLSPGFAPHSPVARAALAAGLPV